MSGQERPLFIWFESPLAAFRTMMLWDLMEAMLSIGKPSRQNVLLFSGETLRSSVLERQTGFGQELIDRILKPISDAIRDENAPLWTLLSFVGMDEIARSHHEYPALDVESRLHTEFRNVYPLNAWLDQWQRFEKVLEDVGERGRCWSQKWQSFASVFWALSDEEQRSLLLRCLSAESRLMWLPDDTNLPNFPRSLRMNWGNGDAEPVLYADIIRLALGREDDMGVLRDIVCHCGWWRAEDGICFMVERPAVIELDDRRRLHGRLEYPDGYRLFALHGVRVSEAVASGNFSAAEIDATNNAEVRRVMIDMYGIAKYLQETDTEVLDRDECGVLYRRVQLGDEPIVMVKVRNATAEPDGSFRNYFLRVPPQMQTAREAVAWTFGMNAKDYKPARET